MKHDKAKRSAFGFPYILVWFPLHHFTITF